MVSAQPDIPSLGRLSSRPDGWRRSTWPGGAFETAYRPRTPHVTGEIASNHHLIMATLRGGARRHAFTNADGHRYQGPDLTGSISFLPAGCLRELELEDVEWRWAAIAVETSTEGSAAILGTIRSLTVNDDPFVFGMIQEMERLDALSGGIESIYAQTMTGALARYLATRFAGQLSSSRQYALAPYKFRRVQDFVMANLGQRLSLAELASLCGLSERHFHRAFKVTTGRTPLEFVTEKRMERARLMLATTKEPILTIALSVGFANPGHFARAFAEATGMTPSDYRRKAVVN